MRCGAVDLDRLFYDPTSPESLEGEDDDDDDEEVSGRGSRPFQRV